MTNRSGSYQLTAGQKAVIVGRCGAEVEPFGRNDGKFLSVFVLGNGREPRVFTVWALNGDDGSGKMMTLHTGIHVNPEVDCGFYGGEVSIGDRRLQLAFLVESGNVVPYYEHDHTVRPEAVAKWVSGAPTRVWGELTELTVGRFADNGQVIIVAGGRTDRFLLGFDHSQRLCLTRVATPMPVAPSSTPATVVV